MTIEMTTAQEHPRYERASSHAGLTPDGPAQAESRALLFRWRQMERTR